MGYQSNVNSAQLISETHRDWARSKAPSHTHGAKHHSARHRFSSPSSFVSVTGRKEEMLSEEQDACVDVVLQGHNVAIVGQVSFWRFFPIVYKHYTGMKRNVVRGLFFTVPCFLFSLFQCRDHLPWLFFMFDWYCITRYVFCCVFVV